MAVTDRARHQLRAQLQASIGHEAADTLMEELGALGHQQVDLRQTVELGFAKVERDMADLKGELKTDMAELRADVAERLETQTRHLMFGMIGSMATISGIAFGAARPG